MELTAFLPEADAGRARRTFEKLRRHDISALALTGGFAIELHLLRRGLGAHIRPLNDIDFLADSFEDIPKTLPDDFIFRHVHPHDPPGRTLLQSVDLEATVRVDIFRAYGCEMERSQMAEFAGFALRMVASDDLIARSARLSLDLASGTPVPAKHAREFLRLAPLGDGARIESVWKEHRKPNHPASFVEAAELLSTLIPLHTDLQIAVDYSKDVHWQCPRCESMEVFPLADADRFLALLGYC